MPDGKVEIDLVLKALLHATLHGMGMHERIEVLKAAGWTDTQIGTATGLTKNAVEKRRKAMKLKGD